jgi:Holliday junction resolvase RusA-like endonuclease
VDRATKSALTAAALQYRAQHSGPPWSGPLRVEVGFSFKRPARGKYAQPIGSATPDVDNLAKFALDSLELAGVIENDSHVCELIARKVYSAEDLTVVRVEELRDQSSQQDPE